jgi:uncharacterized protein YoxC
MTGDSEGRYSEQRDGNLSALVTHIRDDGPAATPVQRPERRAPAPSPAPLIEAPAEPRVSLTPRPGPARGRSRLATGWKRVTMAVVGGAAVALAVTIGLWLDHPAPSLPALASEHPMASKVPESADVRAELRQLAASVAAIQRRIEGLARDSQITTGEVKQLIAQGVQANSDRIDQLQASVERTPRAQSALKVLADRMEKASDRGGQAKEGRWAGSQPADKPAADASEQRKPVQRGDAASIPSTVGPVAAIAAAAPAQSVVAPAGAETAKIETVTPASDEADSVAAAAGTREPSGYPAAATQVGATAPSGAQADADLEDGAAKPAVGSAVAREEASRATSSAGPASPGEGNAHEAAGAAVGQTAAAAVGRTASAGDVRPAPAAAGVHPQKKRPAISSATTAPEPERSTAGSEAEEAASPAEAQEAHWAINLVALTSRERAEAVQAAYADKGVVADVVALRHSGSRVTLYGVSVPGFSSRAEAAAFAPKVKAKLGIREVWIFRR